MLNPIFQKRRTIDGLKKLKKITISTLMILEEAEKQGIKWKRIPRTDVFKLMYKGSSNYFHAQTPSETSDVAFYICKDKRITRNVLEDSGISVSNGFYIKRQDNTSYQKQIFNKLKKPLVVKVDDGYQGSNVYLNISDVDEYIGVVAQVFDYYGQSKKGVLVEEMFEGQEYRVLATRDKVLSIIKRIPANVVGDGQSTIFDLIKTKSDSPRRGEKFTLKPILVDDVLKDFIKEQGLSLDSVLEKNSQVFLRPHSAFDISHGGDTIDMTDQVHSSVNQIALKVINAIPGLSFMGLDYMSKDITVEQTSDMYKVIEVNSAPSLDWNTNPVVGKYRNIPLEFLKIMFPELG